MNRRMTAEVITQNFHANANKPVDHIIRLFTAIDHNCNEIVAEKSETIFYQEEEQRFCYFLIKGSLSLHRRGDGMILTSEVAPFVFGLSNQYSVSDNMYLKVLEQATYLKTPLAAVNEAIRTQGLWEPMAKLLLYTTARVFDHCSRTQLMSAYDIICYKLHELMNESETIRQQTTAASYIKSRTYLSRSGIMRILSELKTGGYIQLEKGILQSIIYLPKKF